MERLQGDQAPASPTSSAVRTSAGVSTRSSGRRIAAAVDELADVAVAAAVPGPVDLAAEAELAPSLGADARARRGRQRVSVGIAQQSAVRVDGPAELVHRAPEVVHRLTVGGAQG